MAPPVVVNPQLVPITAIAAPNTNPLTNPLQTSQTCKKFRTESKNTVGEILYILLAINNPPANPVIKQIIVKIGNMEQQAITRGMTK